MRLDAHVTELGMRLDAHITELGMRLDAHITGVKSNLSLFPRAKIYNKKRYAEKIQMKKK